MYIVGEPHPAGRVRATRVGPGRTVALLAAVCVGIVLSGGVGRAQETGQVITGGDVEQRGNARYVTEHVPLSLGYSGLLLGAVQPGSGKLGVGLYMLAAGGLIAGSFAVPTTPAQAHLSVAYGYRGTLTGLGLSEVLGLNDAGAYCFVGLASGLAAEYGGYQLARSMSAGQARVMTTYTDLGILGGGLLWGLTFQKGDPVPWFLVGEGLGAGAGYARQKMLSYTEGQGLFVRTASVLGALAPAGIIYAVGGSEGIAFLNGRLVVGTALLGSAGATCYAERYIRGYALTLGGGVACAGMTAAGALVGAGFGYLLSPSDYLEAPSGQLISGCATIGTLGGLAVGLAIAKRSLASSPGSSLLPDGRLAVNWSSIPASALTYVRERQFSAPDLVTFRF